MKTKEEIEQLAEKFSFGCSADDAHASYFAFIQGYTQCQEDMADRKYTEEAMLFAFVHGGTKSEENKDASILRKNFKELINSLNKQD